MLPTATLKHTMSSIKETNPAGFERGLADRNRRGTKRSGHVAGAKVEIGGSRRAGCSPGGVPRGQGAAVGQFAHVHPGPVGFDHCISPPRGGGAAR